MIETVLRRCLRGRERVWLLITLICGIGVMVVLPGTDEYNDSRKCRAKLRARMAEMRQQVANIDQLRRAAAEKRTRLEQLETLTIPADDLHVARGEIVAWARKSRCQVRRIHVGEPRSRPWHRGDSLIEADNLSTPGKPNSSYLLNLWPCSLSVSGTLADVRSLLDNLESSKRLISGNKMSLAPVAENKEQVVVDLELTLFNLAKAAPPSG